MSDRDAVDAHPEAAHIQGGESPTDDTGMSVEDAATSAFDDWDRDENGLAEGERIPVGRWMKSHADEAGVTVHEGLESLVETAAALRTGDQEGKRETIGNLIDNYDVRPLPVAEEAAPQFDEFGDPVGQQESVATEAQAMGVVNEFVAANPIARDPSIQATMIQAADYVRQQGFQPYLPSLFAYATSVDARFSGQARQTQEADHLPRARQGTGQVSGGATVTPIRGQTADLDDILNELIPGG